MKHVLNIALTAFFVAGMSFMVQAAAPAVLMQVEVKSSCTDKGAAFEIVNVGQKWPYTAMMRIYTADGKSVISERRLRLAVGQKVTIAVKKEKLSGRTVAVWIEPQWYKRDFKFDAIADCT
ncbi:MAG: hypothetical protein COB59_09905 [Rhodospirillaceae bacterium]|nr:MAG: hypothetical protein COB59_09905 [Rhodospirillaceae bacterium]